MDIKLNFDAARNPELPTIVLSRKSGEKLFQLIPDNLVISDTFNAPAEMYFNTYKSDYTTETWNEISNFKLVWCKEWDTWFEITVEINERNYIEKKITCVQLGQAELSQIMLNGVEINTENDIARDEYKEPTVFWNEQNPSASLLHRLLKDKAKHYKIEHVDYTLAKVQRTFEFNGTSIYDALQEIAEEVGCIFVFSSNSDAEGNINRAISAYDLEYNCFKCNYRGEKFDVCPKCGSTEVIEPSYAEDTGILVSVDELTDEIHLTTDTPSVKNCFKLEAGDDLMNATIRNINPNGSDYIWHITEDTRKEMSTELANKLKQYDEMYKYYSDTHIVKVPTQALNKYNALIDKYKKYDTNLEKIPTDIVGYPNLIKHYYNSIDFYLLLHSSLMPKFEKTTTDATKQAALLTSRTLSPVACKDVSSASLKTVDNLVLSMAKVLITGNYKVKVKTSSMSSQTWNGILTVTSYSNEEDKAETQNLSVEINDNYELFVKQKIEKALKKETINDVSITGLFKLTLPEFKEELKKYCLDYLSILQNCCQSCLDILIEQGVADKETWADTIPNLYNDLYMKYKEKFDAIVAEMKVREDEVNSISGVVDENGDIKEHGVHSYMEEEKDKIREMLDFEKFLGEKLWVEFSAFKREGSYSNSNYISDGLNNGEVIKKAEEFLDVARKEIYKSAELQHSISTNLNNLLANKKFERILDSFRVGNHIRVEVDGVVYELKLTSFELDYKDIERLQVNFSDVISISNNESRAIQNAMKTQAMASSYDTVKRQANKGDNSSNILNGWFDKGMDVTKTKLTLGANNQVQSWDEHGMLFRQYDDILDSYSDRQMKILNSSIIMTDDNWKTVKTAVGLHYYVDPRTKQLESAYGINGEVLVGRLILGEQLGIYSDNNSLSFNKDGLNVTNGKNSFVVNPNDPKGLMKISNATQDLLYLDDTGMLHLAGDGAGIDIGGNATITKMKLDFKEGMMATVSKKELGSEVNTYLSMTTDVIEMKSGLIIWNATNSSMTADGTLTCDNAILNHAAISGSLVTNSGGNQIVLNNGHMAAYYGNRYLGLIGSNGLGSAPNVYGLNFNLQETGDYMSWAAKKDSTSASYGMKWTYNRHGIPGYVDNSLNAGCDIYMQGRNIFLDGTTYLTTTKDSYIRESGSNIQINCPGYVSMASDLNMNWYSILNQSDERLKENIVLTHQDALGMLNQVDIVEYDWRANKQRVNAGMVAQQLNTIMPWLVNVDSKGIYSIKTVEIIPYIIKAIQQLSEILNVQRGSTGFYADIPDYKYGTHTLEEINSAMKLAYDNSKTPNIYDVEFEG